MTRTISALLLGMGLVGGLLAQSAHAESYAYSTQNRDGSRTMYGRYGYSTLPASEFLRRNSGMNDCHDSRYGSYDSRYDSRYGSSRDWYSGRMIDSRYSSNDNPYWSRGASLSRSGYRSVYDDRYDFRAPDRHS